MLTSKYKASEQIIRRLRKYSIDSDIDEREVMLALHQSMGSLIRNRLFESKGMESQEVDGSLYYTKRDISVEKEGNRYFITLPSTTISLPFGVEIKRLGTSDGRGFIPVPNGFLDLHMDLPSSALEGMIGYYKEGTKAYFANMSAANNAKLVDLTMVLPLDMLGEEDEINIPADMLELVIEDIVRKFSGTLQMPSDETSNSTDV